MVCLDAFSNNKRVVAWFPGHLNALPTCKIVVDYFSSPVEDMGCYLRRVRRLNRGFCTNNWRVYELKEESSGVRLVLSILCKSITALERQGWRSFRGVCRAVSVFSASNQREKISKKFGGGRGGGG
jgi:hypothetical protein